MQQIMDNEDIDVDTRMTAAKELAKYIIPNLPRQIEVKATHTVELTEEQIFARFRQLEQQRAQLPSIDAVFEEIVNAKED